MPNRPNHLVPRSRCEGSILFEVVLSLALFLLAAALVGGSIRMGMAAADRIAQRSRALSLAESMLAMIRADYVPAQDGAEGDFMPQFPGYRYRMEVTQSPDLPTLNYVTVTVTWDLPSRSEQAGDTESVSLVGWLWKVPPAEEGTAEGGTDSAAGGSSAASGGTGGSGNTGGSGATGGRGGPP